jgi:hypothetical protein
MNIWFKLISIDLMYVPIVQIFTELVVHLHKHCTWAFSVSVWHIQIHGPRVFADVVGPASLIVR